MRHRFPLLLLTLLAGCAVGPNYERPAVAVPTAYKEATGAWKPAEPRDEALRGKWWTVYGDAELDALVDLVAIDNQNVKQAEAQFRQANAALDAARAGFWPTLGAGVSSARGRNASATSTTGGTTASGIRETDKATLSASWEADVWGRIRRSVESGDASAAASAADLQAALLSAQATLVQTWFQWRANARQRQLLDNTVAAYRHSLEITRNRFDSGVAGRVDVVQAESQLKSTEAQAAELRLSGAQLEHAIALLVGKAPADLKLPPALPDGKAAALPPLPAIPPQLPSALLERRPDIAGAERRAAAANAQIGVAQSAFFPALTFAASGGYQNSAFSHLISAPNRFWSLGPTLALTLFDAGARSAQKAQAVAAHDKSVAAYRQTVLTAFQEVEDNLAALRILGEEEEYQRAAAAAAAETLRLTDNQYQSGTVSYLNVVVAQATALSAERNLLDVQNRRLVASVALLKALGGGWTGESK